MPFRGLFAWVDTLESSVSLRESLNAYPFLLTAHVVSMCLFAGLIAFWDLRLVGFALRPVPVPEFGDPFPLPTRIFRWALAGFTISFITGMLLLYSKPMTYYTNFYFWLKTSLMILAGINMFVFHFTTNRSVERWENDARPPHIAVAAGVVSLVLWASVVVTGRLMAHSGLVPDWWKALELS